VVAGTAGAARPTALPMAQQLRVPQQPVQGRLGGEIDPGVGQPRHDLRRDRSRYSGAHSSSSNCARSAAVRVSPAAAVPPRSDHPAGRHGASAAAYAPTAPAPRRPAPGAPPPPPPRRSAPAPGVAPPARSAVLVLAQRSRTFFWSTSSAVVSASARFLRASSFFRRAASWRRAVELRLLAPPGPTQAAGQGIAPPRRQLMAVQTVRATPHAALLLAHPAVSMRAANRSSALQSCGRFSASTCGLLPRGERLVPTAVPRIDSPIALGNRLLAHLSSQRTTDHGLSDLLGVLHRL